MCKKTLKYYNFGGSTINVRKKTLIIIINKKSILRDENFNSGLIDKLVRIS